MFLSSSLSQARKSAHTHTAGLPCANSVTCCIPNKASPRPDPEEPNPPLTISTVCILNATTYSRPHPHLDSLTSQYHQHAFGQRHTTDQAKTKTATPPCKASRQPANRRSWPLQYRTARGTRADPITTARHLCQRHNSKTQANRHTPATSRSRHIPTASALFHGQQHQDAHRGELSSQTTASLRFRNPAPHGKIRNSRPTISSTSLVPAYPSAPWVLPLRISPTLPRTPSSASQPQTSMPRQQALP